MAGRGRPRKPTALHAIQGTWRPDRHGDPEDEPQYADGIGEPPGWLGPEALAEWNRVVAECKKVPGLLKRVDRDMLAAYSDCVATWRHCNEVLQEAGSLTFETDSGYVQQRPEVGIRQRALEQIKAFGSEFGFAPGCRSKMTPPRKPKEKGGKLSKYVG